MQMTLPQSFTTSRCVHPPCQEHGEGTVIKLMPESFQLIPEGSKLFAKQDSVPHAQHDRAAAVVARAQRWITVSVRTMSGGPDKWTLRLLLAALAMVLLSACFGYLCLTAIARLLRARGKR